MKIRHLMEGAEPKMPGAPQGIQIMTPQQFVANAGDMPGEEEVDEGVRDLGYDAQSLIMKLRRDVEEKRLQPTPQAVLAAARELAGDMEFAPQLLVKQVLGQGVAEGSSDTIYPNAEVIKSKNGKPVGEIYQDGNSWGCFHYKADRGYDFIDSREEAIEALKDLHQETGRSRPDYTIKGVAEGVGNFAKAMDTLGGWYQERDDEGGEVFYFDDREGGYYADGIVKHDPQTGKITVDFEDKSGEYGGDIRGAFNSIGDAMNVLRGTFIARRGGGKAHNHDSLGGRDLAGPEHLYKTDKAGKKGTLTKSRMDQMKMSSQSHMRGGPKGVLPEGEEHLNRIRKLSGLEEATKLPASSREFGGDEFQDYMKRIVGTPDVDKAGNVKTDKKGNEKYVSGKTKTDRYKMPYIHRSSVIEYLGPDGKTYDEDKIKQALAQRPKALLKQNEKMKHSNGELEQFFNVGFAALTGIALDQETNKLIIVNTCPGAGSCKVDCFAMKGGKVQFKAAWQSDGRILTYLLNDPDGFFNQLSAEISKEEKLGQKGGYAVTIRWHDAGDFFSPEYLDLALKMAAKHPDTKFYAYTKMAGAALGNKPPNFIINWSEGANTAQEKQVKAKDANLDTTKNSRIVPDELFQDLLVKDEKKNLVKGASGQWQVQPDKLPELKQRLAKEYGLSSNSILSYDEYMAKRKSIPQGMKYNVIVAPGEGDISANDPNIISTLLLKH
jgi:hypothetical protein